MFLLTVISGYSLGVLQAVMTSSITYSTAVRESVREYGGIGSEEGREVVGRGGRWRVGDQYR